MAIGEITGGQLRPATDVARGAKSKQLIIAKYVDYFNVK
jgi:hypothetical protein